MKIKLNEDIVHTGELMQDIVISRIGVRRYNELVKAYEDGSNGIIYKDVKIKGMDEAKELFLKHVNENNTIAQVADCDCFTGDTKIKLINGTVKTFKELYDSNEENFEVYSCKEDGEVVTGTASRVIRKAKVNRLIKITLDNGHVIKCTPDHRLMLSDGGYMEAKDLKELNSLMSLYVGVNTVDHKVKYIENIKTNEYVYDVEVMKYHNFLIVGEDEKTGVFVHNCDGIMSAAQLSFHFPQIKTVFHEGKQHGLGDKRAFSALKSLNPSLIVISDAGTNDVPEFLSLMEGGTDVIILDHHEPDLEAHGIIKVDSVVIKHNGSTCVRVNPFIGQQNTSIKDLTGAGVVYRFLQEVLEKTITGTESLAAIGQIGDVSDISSKNIANMVSYGLENIDKHPYINSYIDVENRKLAAKDLSMSFIPVVNSICRIGTMEDKQELFDAVTQNPYTYEIETVTKRKKNKKTGKMDKVDIDRAKYLGIKERNEKVKKEQKKIVDKTMEKLNNGEESSIIDTGSVIIAKVSGGVGSLSGLVAAKLMDKYEKPAIYLQERDNKLSGSARCNESIVENFKDWCSNHVEMARGHQGAFGITIDDLDNFIENTQELKSGEKAFTVDKINDKIVDHADLEDYETYKYMFGGDVRHPMLAYTNITAEPKNIDIKKNMATIYYRGITFVMYDKPKWLEDAVLSKFGGNISFNIVGEPGCKSWGSGKNLQIIVKDIEEIQIVEDLYDF